MGLLNSRQGKVGSAKNGRTQQPISWRAQEFEDEHDDETKTKCLVSDARILIRETFLAQGSIHPRLTK
jgi:hypothetical protein